MWNLKLKSSTMTSFAAICCCLALLMTQIVHCEHASSEVWSDNDGIQMTFSTDHEMGSKLSLKRESSSPSSAASQQQLEAVDASQQQSQIKREQRDQQEDNNNEDRDQNNNAKVNEDRNDENESNNNNNKQQENNQNLSFESASEQVGDTPSNQGDQGVQDQSNLDEDAALSERQQESLAARFKSPGRLFQQALRMNAVGDNQKQAAINDDASGPEQREHQTYDSQDESSGESDDNNSFGPTIEDRKSSAPTPSNGRKFLSNFELDQASASRPEKVNRNNNDNNIDHGSDEDSSQDYRAQQDDQQDSLADSKQQAVDNWPTLSGSETSKTQQKLRNNNNNNARPNQQVNTNKSASPRFASVHQIQGDQAMSSFKQQGKKQATIIGANLPTGNYFRNVGPASQRAHSPDEVRDEFISPGHFPGSMAHLTQAASELTSSSKKSISETPSKSIGQQVEEASSKIDATIMESSPSNRGIGATTATTTTKTTTSQVQVTPEPMGELDSQQIMAPVLIPTTTPMPRASEGLKSINNNSSVSGVVDQQAANPLKKFKMQQKKQQTTSR